MPTLGAVRIIMTVIVMVVVLPGVRAQTEPVCDKVFLCFFGPGSVSVSARCRQIVSEAADTWRELRDGRDFCGRPLPTGKPPLVKELVAEGHASESGDADVNQVLSERRAQAIANELIGFAVPAAKVSIVGFGDERPLVFNADRNDPQNRYAYIIFR